MAFPTAAAVLLNENMQIHKGNRVDAPSAKPLKSSAKPERKALQDVSNIPKGTALKNRSTVKEGSALKERPALHNVSNNLKERSILKERPPLQDVSNTRNERSILKEKSALCSHEAIKNPVNIFADDEETKGCHEWAKDGMEGTHFTGNDSQKLDKDVQHKRIKKKVAKVTSALYGWSHEVYGHVMFMAMVPKFSEESKELELEPEILPDITRCMSTSGKRDDAPSAKRLKPKLQEPKALQVQDLSNTVKGSPSLCSHEAVKNPVKIFTVEETKKCHESANDVSEGTHFTGNDRQKLDKDVQGDKTQLVEDSPTDDELDDYPFLDNSPVKFELKDESVIPDIGAI
ncbi:uncharacterized protein [Zea mays]|uniref:Uncharacterized protein n=3 Tax=Zea mays TaxID=4577 RepID=A0A1D6M3V9_MAIZE|nr:uncharacterized protein LOC100276328 isoform X2 [Zea mays]XP_020394464.1 uncharacterized protein LOC100276328 isoform X2 [Zea mays]XP_035815390.1 uncharacterized protein LOC100276328 isoform X2 [Zea mays]XP_035815391.1 uncharacterized protein LOC100276328 isoform X2 [Zea mays]XP_035815392.1 uncharacterized protein LOC100276328 isoform X2 [Zea mays]AQK85822.1 hypothetical protein ZEAMMB73_Zm00001d038149 [Zea mays]AQK85824.1 hypothetical protein ZEAMMB73_Zm00001d038149 [Zea mays]AQK85827.1 |eukprot:XP_008647649.1 uncharacterized protein LOC100276328 isoform X2 [Zea mays]